MGSKPCWAMKRRASSLVSSVIWRSLSLARRSPSMRSTMRSISGWVRGLNRTMSSRRFRNSGRKCARISAITRSRASGLISPSDTASAVSHSEPMLEVMMMTVLRKSTVRPCASVSRPLSRTCSSVLKTSGAPFQLVEQHRRVRLAPGCLGERSGRPTWRRSRSWWCRDRYRLQLQSLPPVGRRSVRGRMPPARCAARREHAEAVSSAGDLDLARLGGLGLRDGQREHPVGELAPYRVGVDVAGQVGAELEPAGAARAAVSAAASVLTVLLLRDLAADDHFPVLQLHVDLVLADPG